MITMRNIWIMMLGICLFGCGAAKQPLSSQLSLTWKLEKDSVEARYFKNTFYFQRGINRLLIINWCLIKIDHPIISQGFIPVIRQTECILKISGFHTIFFQFPC